MRAAITTSSEAEVLLQLDDVVKRFPVQTSSLLRRSREHVHAVGGVSLQIRRGETLGLVGETGCGKSTLARCASRLYPIDAGRISFAGRDISRLSRRHLRPVRRQIQMIFQDPYGSLNPRRRVGSIIADPLRIHDVENRGDRKRHVQDTMELVGLNPEHYNRFPAEFSGGQRQRIGVARALIIKPELIICDEPVSALDVSIQAQILNLLGDLQNELGLTYLFIAHDLSVVRHISDRVAVMYLGTIAEIGATEQVFTHPRHPYTAALLSAAQEPDPDLVHRQPRIILPGDPPSPITLPTGCRFHPRCPKAEPECATHEPELVARLHDHDSHRAACLFPVRDGEQLALTGSAASQGLAGPPPDPATAPDATVPQPPTTGPSSQ